MASRNNHRDPLEEPTGLPSVPSCCISTVIKLIQEHIAAFNNDSCGLHCNWLEPVSSLQPRIMRPFALLRRIRCCRKDRIVWQSVSEYVTSQQRLLLPPLKGNTVRSSGLRPSPRSSSTGFRHEDIPVAARPSFTMSFRFA